MLPEAPPFDPSMIPPGSMMPVFPKEETPARLPPVADEAQASAQAKVRNRAAYLAVLANDPDFTAHVLDGWLKEQEDTACHALETSPQSEVIEARSTWKAVKTLRQNLRDELKTALAKLKS